MVKFNVAINLILNLVQTYSLKRIDINFCIVLSTASAKFMNALQDSILKTIVLLRNDILKKNKCIEGIPFVSSKK